MTKDFDHVCTNRGRQLRPARYTPRPKITNPIAGNSHQPWAKYNPGAETLQVLIRHSHTWRYASSLSVTVLKTTTNTIEAKSEIQHVRLRRVISKNEQHIFANVRNVAKFDSIKCQNHWLGQTHQWHQHIPNLAFRGLHQPRSILFPLEEACTWKLVSHCRGFCNVQDKLGSCCSSLASSDGVIHREGNSHQIQVWTPNQIKPQTSSHNIRAALFARNALHFFL